MKNYHCVIYQDKSNYELWILYKVCVCVCVCVCCKWQKEYFWRKQVWKCNWKYIPSQFISKINKWIWLNYSSFFSLCPSKSCTANMQLNFTDYFNLFQKSIYDFPLHCHTIHKLLPLKEESEFFYKFL